MTDADRIERLQVKLSRLQMVTGIMGLGLIALLVAGVARDPIQDEIKAHRIALVDSKGVERVVLAENTGRMHGQSAGIYVLDDTGAERGGMSTFEDGRVTMALDAPVGVGSPMRDRLGLAVYKDGGAALMLNNNDTGVPVRLVANAEGGGGLELINFDHETKTAHIRRLTHSEDVRQELPFGD
jgi:hypothetical protein